MFTYSNIHFGLEKGGDQRPKGGERYMRIPIGKALGKSGRVKRSHGPTAKRFTKGSAQRKRQVVIRMPRTGDLWLFEKSSAKSKRGRAAGRTKVLLEPIAVLVPKVRRKKRLSFMNSWEALRHKRDDNIRQILIRSVDDMQKGRRSG